MTVDKEFSYSGDTSQVPTEIEKKLFKCAATEAMLKGNGDAVAECGLATDKKSIPGTEMLVRNVICTACFESCTVIQDSDGKLMTAILPECEFALDLVTQARNYEIESVRSVTNA